MVTKPPKKEYGTVSTPFVVDMGKEKRRRIRKLKRGRGRLAEEVDDIVTTFKDSLGEKADGKEFVPVVVIYRRKRKRGGKSAFPFPMPFR